MEIIRRAVTEAAAVLAAAGVHPVLARVYAARGVVTADELETDLSRLPPFSQLKGIDLAAARLADAIARGERILVIADYDADGATACALAVRGLAAMGAVVEFLVPNRFEYGYGLTPEIVVDAATRAPRLIVTVDNGIASHEGVALAAAHGIDVLITDHHLPAATLPAPALIVNPNQPGCPFPAKHLAGVGVMFYVLIATRALMRERGAFAGRAEPNLAVLLDLVALGTVADVVRLDRVNRTLVAQGLARIRAGRCLPGIAALFSAAGRDTARATAYDLGFVAGPRLNAAGRLADMTLGIRCLLADTAVAAFPLATELDRLNRERRDVEATMHQEALAEIEARTADSAGDAYTLCLFHEDWHQGVVGIVASRLKDRYHRPAIVFARGSGSELKGSGRSIPGFHLRDALDLITKRVPGVITRFGGHAYAAGLSLAEPDLPTFAAAFETVAREALTAGDLARVQPSDGGLEPAEVTLDHARALAGEVWGQGFPSPAFDDVFDVADQRTVAGKHSKLILERRGDGAPVRFSAILFNRVEPLPATIRAVYRPDPNEWNGTVALQLVVSHWEPVEPVHVQASPQSHN
jgi:single-stranded-DNA-specific exonuclease